MQDARFVLDDSADQYVNGNEISSFVWTSTVGVSGFDYLTIFTGKTSAMTKMMNGVANGSLFRAFAEAGMAPVAECVTDLHHSHLMVAPE